MPQSWNEIKQRASEFSKEWENETNEDAEAKSFWDQFFNIFGISRRRVASFEQYVHKLGKSSGFIDLFWPGMLLIEHKSKGKDLEKAYGQGLEYFQGLKESDLPKYIIVSDFERIKLYDIDENIQNEFHLKDLVNNISLFGFIAGYQKRIFKEQDPVNIQAALQMGKLHDKLYEIGYQGHRLEVYLVRLLFCLFADDTSIFERGIFKEYIETKTNEDGSDLAGRLGQLFEVLNTPIETRFKNLDESLSTFPYVNGKLFEEQLPTASFDGSMRTALLDASGLDWGKISPAIFGSLFQSVMNAQERRNLGAHYTSEKNILKLIKPLFLDELWEEYEKVKKDRRKLASFHNKLATLKFLDPACGCGNFLIITYRELRLLEMEVLKTLYFKGSKGLFDIRELVKIEVDQFYGIEYEEFPAQIAQVAMWLIDHQMNMRVSELFGLYYIRLPLKKSATIIHGNALLLDWSHLDKTHPYDVNADIINIFKVSEEEEYYKTLNVYSKTININPVSSPILHSNGKNKYDYILGNPPFIGKSMQNAEQKADMERVFTGIKGSGVLDYVAAWYVKAAQLIQNTTTKVAFVSTNSISQGEQVGILWNLLFNHYKIKIHFAHRTFSWSNEAKGNAAVHVVIIGFANYDTIGKGIYEYDDIFSEPHEIFVNNINPYLVSGKDFVITSRSKPLCQVPEILFGNMPNDGGNLVLSNSEKDELIKSDPSISQFIKPLISAYEFINGEKRWCLWLKDVQPNEYRDLPEIMRRITLVKELRENSSRAETRKLANYPSLFGEIRQPESSYILIPRHSSEIRKYIPMGFFSKDYIASDSCLIIPNAGLYHFGILNSTMHMTWVKYTSGKIKSDFRYSNTIVYNNYPWPENASVKQMKVVEEAVNKILDIRLLFPYSSLADLYDPLTMPPALVKAHSELDKAVDHCYRSQVFNSEIKRIEYLFELYAKYTAPLLIKNKRSFVTK